MGHILNNHKIIVNIVQNSMFVVFNTYYNVLFCVVNILFNSIIPFCFFNQVEMIISYPRTADFVGNGPAYNH